MSDPKSEFMGRVTASVTHEIQNVLAVIKESAGLMEDLTLLMNQGQGLSGMEEKVASCLRSIKNQAYRGVSLTSRLNAFAHSPDYSVFTFNPVETIKKLLGISERIFRLKGTVISFTEPDFADSLTTDPLGFQMLVFACLETLTLTLSPERISMDFESRPGEAVIRFSVAAPRPDQGIPDQKQMPENLTQTCRMLGGHIEATNAPFGICLILPHAPK